MRRWAELLREIQWIHRWSAFFPIAGHPHSQAAKQELVEMVCHFLFVPGDRVSSHRVTSRLREEIAVRIVFRVSCPGLVSPVGARSCDEIENTFLMICCSAQCPELPVRSIAVSRDLQAGGSSLNRESPRDHQVLHASCIDFAEFYNLWHCPKWSTRRHCGNNEDRIQSRKTCI